jgi:hypothetical protein
MNRRSNIGLRLLAVAAAAVLTVSACSNDDDSSTTTTTAPNGTAAGTPASTPPSSTPPSSTPGEPGETTVPAEGATTTAPPPPTAPPTTGDINQVVEAPPAETLASVALSDPVDVPNARLEITSVKRVDAEARLPGEVAGPAVAVTVSISNTGETPIDLGAVTVNVADAAGTASAPLTAAPNAPLAGELAPGADAEGVYLFDFGPGSSEPINVQVSAAVESPTAVFVGPIN